MIVYSFHQGLPILFKWMPYCLDNALTYDQKEGNLILVDYLTMKPYELKPNNKGAKDYLSFLLRTTCLFQITTLLLG